jgi:AhpD family alkylhydroperoxidase
LRQVRRVSVIRPSLATGLVARVYTQVERDFGMLAPPIALHSQAELPLAASWLMLRESLLATGVVDRATKEHVATAVSSHNACPYCVQVHGATLRGMPGPIADPALQAVTRWADGSGTRGTAGLAPPFPAAEAAELVGVAVTFHYLNRMANVFLADSPLPAEIPDAARGGAARVLRWFMGSMAAKVYPPGAALPLLPRAARPADLPWAAANPTVADAFARAVAAIDSAGAAAIPAPVRELVSARLSEWDGQPPGLTRSWVTDAASDLPADQRPTARLALLTAFASYQVDDSTVTEFRRHHPDDRTLIEVCSWASMAAARQVGAWAAVPPSAGTPARR